jgi:hypothetical protein
MSPPNLKQMDHLLESKHGASVPCLQSEFNDTNYSHYKNDSSIHQRFHSEAG